MKNYNLKPVTGQQKSFYGKAQIIELDNGDLLLQSYNTIVCGVVAGEFVKYWNDYSLTTMNHINAFIATFTGLHMMNKKEWLSLETSNKPATRAVVFDYEKAVKNPRYQWY